MIVAAADGSALGNPGPAGWSWYIDDQQWAAGGWAHGTNNMGELMAVLQLLQATEAVDDSLLILCDSQYVINAITKWMPNWKRKGWKKADGKPVMNQDLMVALDTAMQGRRVEFEWVKGHAGHDLNEAADLRARAAATAYQQGQRPDAGPGFLGPGQVGDVDAVAPGAALNGTSGLPGTVSPVEVEVEATLFDLDEPIDDLAEVVAAEQALLDPEVRADVARVAALLEAEWREIGASGRLWNRADILDAVASNTSAAIGFELLESRRLADDLILIIWRASAEAGSSLRSSIWRRDHGQWRQLFHQGTVEP